MSERVMYLTVESVDGQRGAEKIDWLELEDKLAQCLSHKQNFFLEFIDEG